MRYEKLPMERLRNLRIDRDLSQKYIAGILNMDQAAYSKYELGERKVPVEALKILADFYETSIDYLVGRTDNPKSI